MDNKAKRRKIQNFNPNNIMKKRRTETKAQRSKIMSRVKSKNTKPELAVRRFIHSLGFRYRLHDKNLPGKPDLVFRKRQRVIFVHGCFWHGHDCRAGHNRPSSNQTYWDKKLKQNMKRDSKNEKHLKEIGWRYFIIWECQIKNLLTLETKIRRFLCDKQK